MQQIAITIPTEVLVSPASKFGFLTDRRTLNLAGGGLRSRARGRRPAKTISISPGLMSSGDLDKLHLALLQIRQTGGCFWAINPEERVHVDRLATPLTDGTRTTFQIGVVSASDVTVFADGVPVDSSTYTIHDAANLVTDGCSQCLSTSYLYPINGSGSTSLNAITGEYCLKVTPTAGYPYVVPAVKAPGTQGLEYTSSAWILNTDSTYKSFEMRVSWFTSGGSYITYTGGGSVTVEPGEWTRVQITSTAPSGSAECLPNCLSLTGSTADPYYVDGFRHGAGDYETWHLPSESPSLVEFDTAPTAGTVITVTAYGKAITRYALQREVGWAEEAGGYKIPDVIQGTESPEVR